MLLPNYLQHVADTVVALWEQLNLFAVKDIARRITDAGDHMTASADWQKYKMEQAGQTAAEIRKEVKRITNLSDADVKKIFEESMLTSYENDSKVFEAAGAKPQPFNTKEAQKLLKALYDQTNGELHNFTRTMPNASQQIYIKACDDALMRVSSGLQSKEQAIQEAIEKAAADGLYITYPSGHRDTVEVAVRRAVTTGVNQASLKMCVNECETVGTNYVIVSSHLGARTGDTQHGNHAGWQGQVYRLKDRQKGFWGMFEHLADMAKGRDYPLLEEATGYPTDPTGLGGYNCRHNMMPFFPGVSENHMKQYGAEENAEAYENSQKQRAKERDLRKRRRVIEADKAAGIDCKEEQAAYKEKLDEYNDFCKKNGLTPALERTHIAHNAQTVAQRNAGKKIEITDQAIDKVKTVPMNGVTDEVSEEVCKAHKDILKHSRKKNNNNEVACLVNVISGERYSLVNGSNDEVCILKDTNSFHAMVTAESHELMLCHNHPACSYFSNRDILFFLGNKSIKVMSIVTNQGKVWFINKLEKYDTKAAWKLYAECSKKYGEDYDKAIGAFLKKGYTVGIERN